MTALNFLLVDDEKPFIETLAQRLRKRGFTVEVDKKHVEYVFNEGVYFVNNKDADWFFVEEFDVI